MTKEIEKLIKETKQCAAKVFEELGAGWEEKIYQKAMEIILREKGIDYEEQRPLPVTFLGKVVGEGYPDLIVWLKTKKKRIALVIDLKATSEIQQDHEAQVAKYIQELKKQLKKDEEVLPLALFLILQNLLAKK